MIHVQVVAKKKPLVVNQRLHTILLQTLQLRQPGKADTELSKDKPRDNAKSKSSETVKDTVVLLGLRLLWSHDVDGLNGNVVWGFRHVILLLILRLI